MISVQQLQQLHDVPMQKLLQHQIYNNTSNNTKNNIILGIALSKSKNQQLTVSLCQLIKQCMKQQHQKQIQGISGADPTKWLQVLRRMIHNDFDTAFKALTQAYSKQNDNIVLFQPLISQLFNPQRQHKQQHIQKSMNQQINNMIIMSINTGDSRTLRNILKCYMRQCIHGHKNIYKYNTYAIYNSNSIKNITKNTTNSIFSTFKNISNSNSDSPSHRSRCNSVNMALQCIFQIICKQYKTIYNLLSPLSNIHNNNNSSNNLSSTVEQWLDHYAAIQLLQQVFYVMHVKEKMAVSNLQVLKFKQYIKQAMSCLCLKHIPAVYQLMCTVHIIIDKSMDRTVISKFRHVGNSIIGLLEQQNNAHLKQYYQSVCRIVRLSASIHQLQTYLSLSSNHNNNNNNINSMNIFMSNKFNTNNTIHNNDTIKQCIHLLIQTIANLQFIGLNLYTINNGMNTYNNRIVDQNVVRQLLYINEQISSQQYSDTLVGCYISMIVELCLNVGGIFQQYLSKVVNNINNQLQYNNSSDDGNKKYGINMQMINNILLISILSNSEILEQRQQQLQPHIAQITQAFMVNIKRNIYNQYQQIQILRYFLLFIAKINNNINNNDNNKKYRQRKYLYEQQMVGRAIHSCLTTMNTVIQANNAAKQQMMMNQSHPYSNYSSSNKQLSGNALYKQCQNILQSLVQMPKILKIIQQNIPSILTQFLRMPPCVQFLQIFKKFLINVPAMIERSSNQIIQYVYDAWIKQIQTNDHRNKSNNNNNMQSNLQTVIKILQIYQVVLENATQISHDVIDQMVIQPIFSKLCDKQCIYQQQILQIFFITLAKHTSINPKICIILSSLPELYKRNNRNLFVFGKLYFILSSSSHLYEQLMYQYNTIIQIMVNLIMDYLQNNLTVQQYMHYHREVTQLFEIIIIFFNHFNQYIVQNKTVRNRVIEASILAISKLYHQANLKMMQYQRQSSDKYGTSNIHMYYQFQQLLLLLFMTVGHLLLSPSLGQEYPNFYPSIMALIKETTAKICNNQQNSNKHVFEYMQTARMVPIIIINQFHFMQLQNNDGHTYSPQQIMHELVDFCQLIRQLCISSGMEIKRQSKQLKYPVQKYWKSWPHNVKQYIQNVLRLSKNINTIQQLQFFNFMQIVQNILN